LAEAQPIFDWLGTLELTGVPQIAIASSDNPDLFCTVQPTDQSASGSATLIPNILVNITPLNGVYIDTATTQKYFNGLDSSVFLGGAKILFSPDQFTCCLPPGAQTANTDTPDICCSGLIYNGHCVLDDYTDLSVYYNLYISSEGQNVPPSQIDSKTGYITNPGTIESMACSVGACASGKVALGVVLSNLKVVGFEDSQQNVANFIDTDNSKAQVNMQIAQLYDAGLRWNTHVYCVPSKLASNPATGLTVIDCGAYGTPTASP
jgi:hypothetical protein